MRCPHCRGEIPEVSHFCGVCGQDVTRPPTGVAKSGGYAGASSGVRHTQSGSSSLFELPISTGARRARLGMLVVLNLLLALGGVALINGYMNKRDLAAQAAGLPGAESSSSSAPTSTDSTPEGTEKGQKSPADQVEKGASGSDGDLSKIVGKPAIATAPGDPTTAKPTTDAGNKPGPPDAGATPQPKAKAVDGGHLRPKPPTKTGGRHHTHADAFAQPPPRALSEEEEAARVRRLSAKIKLVVSRHQGQLTRCYQSAAKASNPNEPLEGRIRVHFAVHPDGLARSVGVISNSTGSSPLSKCIVGLIRSWTFPSSGGDALEFVWPFDFQAPQ